MESQVVVFVDIHIPTSMMALSFLVDTYNSIPSYQDLQQFTALQC